MVPVAGVPVVGVVGVVVELPPAAPTLAVTVAVCDVVSTVDAWPLLSVVTVPDESEPADVVKTTGAPASALPLMSNTLAVITLTPPNDDTFVGFAPTLTEATDAVPREILIGLAAVVAAPEIALIVAVPLFAPARNVTVARPFTSVVVVDG